MSISRFGEFMYFSQITVYPSALFSSPKNSPIFSSKAVHGGRCLAGGRPKAVRGDPSLCRIEASKDISKLDTPPKTNECPLKRNYFSREIHLNQPLIFRGYSFVFREVCSKLRTTWMVEPHVVL